MRSDIVVMGHGPAPCPFGPDRPASLNVGVAIKTGFGGDEGDFTSCYGFSLEGP